jgi:hypothetical protein
MEKVDYFKIKAGKTDGITYMVNYQCFERLAMSGDSEESESVRMYFVKLREFITENQKLIYQLIKKIIIFFIFIKTINFFAVDDRKQNIFKICRTIDIIKILRNYNNKKENKRIAILLFKQCW